MLQSTIPLFKVRGIPVGINWTWLLVFLLVIWSLAAGVFPSDYPGRSGLAYLAMAAAATLLLFASILVHELSHTLRSLREGVHVREITLWLFGGVSRADEAMPTPGAEFRIVAAGPVATAILVAVFWSAAAAGRAADLPDTVVGVASYLAGINLLLLVFNLVPALPLDGGRLLHSALWRRSGDRTAATVAAAVGGRAFAVVLIGLGLLGLLAGVGVTAIWFVFLGWFLLAAVDQEVAAALVERSVRGLRVRDLMVDDPVTVDPRTTVAELTDRVARRSPHGAYPVVDGGHLVGLMSLRRAGRIPRPERPAVAVADVMVPLGEVPVIRPDDPMTSALDALEREPGRAVVIDGTTGDEVVGLLSTSDLSGALQRGAAGVTPRSHRSGAFALAVVVGLMVLVAAAVVYHPPFAVIEPGASFDVRGDVTITGVPVQRPTGPYLLTSVRLVQPSALGLLLAAFRSDRDVVALADVTPQGVPEPDAGSYEHELFTDSQQIAAAAAAREAGYAASLTGTGAEVVGVLGSAPAADVLRAGDVITAVDGRPVATTDDLRSALAGRPAGQEVRLTVERAGRTTGLTVETTNLPAVAGGTGIGIIARTRDLQVELPFTVSFRERPGIGGPSAGLVYALTITDMLDRTDDARSRAVAATGTIGEDGTVGEVGGVHEKAIAAHGAGAEQFIVPASEVHDVDLGDLDVHGVTTLDQAVRTLLPV